MQKAECKAQNFGVGKADDIYNASLGDMSFTPATPKSTCLYMPLYIIMNVESLLSFDSKLSLAITPFSQLHPLRGLLSFDSKPSVLLTFYQLLNEYLLSNDSSLSFIYRIFRGYAHDKASTTV